MQRHLMISDGHLSLKLCPSEIEVIRRYLIRLLGENSRAGQAIDWHYDQQRERHMRQTVSKALLDRPYDGFVSLGDNTMDWQYEGLATAGEIEEALRFRLLPEDQLGIGKDQQIWVQGNHDTGWGHSTWCNFRDHPDRHKFEIFEQVYGPSYGLRPLSGVFDFIWLSTVHVETLVSRAGITSDVKLDFLVAKQKEELEFLERTLSQTSKKFFLGIHDPGSFFSPQLQEILNHHRDRRVASFTGHIHAWWLMEFLKLCRPSFRPVFRKYRVQFIPSIWGVVLPFPFWPTGAGWAQLLFADNRAQLEIHRIGRRRPWTIRLT